jgi:D-3-phosphoglycerate dehydrogenase/C-terminal binding protein
MGNSTAAQPIEALERAGAEGHVAIVDSVRGGYVRDTRIEAEILGPLAEVELIRAESASEVADRLREAEVLIAWHQIALDRADLEGLTRCRGIVRASVGIDNIDLGAARELGIELSNVPDYGTEEVADHTLALVLAVARNLTHVAAAARRGEWRWQAIGEVRRLRGRRLGIVGLGRIGTAVAMRAAAFGLEVAFYDPYVAVGADKALGLVRAGSLGELAAESDILTLHVPLTEETRGMVGAEELALLPSHGILVNTCRGEVVDQEALLAALERGRLAGAGLDVLAEEPTVPAPLRSHERVVLTAHSAFYSEEALAELRAKAALAARRVLTDSAERYVRSGEAPQ